MAIQPQTAKAALVRIDANQGAGIESLGYGREGVELEHEAFWEDVFSDRRGGSNGTPIDVVYLSESGRVMLELSEWEESVLDKIRARIAGGTAGTLGTSGTLMFTESNKTFRVIIASTTEPRNYTRCIPRGVWTINKGTKHSRCVIAFDCYENASAVLYNESTS